MNSLMKFENNNVEVFEFNGKVLFNPKNVAECLNISDVNSSIRKFSRKQVTKLTNSDMHGMQFRKLNNAGENFLTESGVYKLIFKSNKPNAEKFQDWVTDEVLPTIRKTGGYVSNDDMFINTYLPYADESTKTMFKSTLETVRKQNELIQHKQEVINGLTKEIPVTTKKDIINRVVKWKKANYRQRYNELYKSFREVHHIDLKARCEGYNKKQAKKKDKLSVIKFADKMGYTDKLYDIACKLYESNVNEIKEYLGIVY